METFAIYIVTVRYIITFFFLSDSNNISNYNAIDI